MTRGTLWLGLLATALALAGCAGDVDESTGDDVGGGDCPDSMDETTTGLDNDDTANVAAGVDGGVQESTGGGDCPDAAGMDDDPNVHETTTDTTTDTTTGGAYP